VFKPLRYQFFCIFIEWSNHAAESVRSELVDPLLWGDTHNIEETVSASFAYFLAWPDRGGKSTMEEIVYLSIYLSACYCSTHWKNYNLCLNVANERLIQGKYVTKWLQNKRFHASNASVKGMIMGIYLGTNYVLCTNYVLTMGIYIYLFLRSIIVNVNHKYHTYSVYTRYFWAMHVHSASPAYAWSGWE
jgi:hypothetical protein